jgi:hypothetical protein
MTPTREELMAQIAETEKGRIDGLNAFQAAHHRLDELRAKLAALDAQPHWICSGIPDEAVEAGIAAWDKAKHDLENYTSGETADWDEGMIVCAIYKAMAPLAPAPLPMGEDEIEALVDEALRAAKRDAVSPNNACVARHAIRETLRRVPAWPGEGELREMARAIAREGFLGASYHVKDAALEMARRLKARMGAGSGAECDICNGLNTSCPEGCERDPKTGELLLGEQPWIDWHGGECPVPAETRVEYKLRNGEVRTAKAGQLVWEHPEVFVEYHIVAYRIIPGEEA